MKLLNIYLYDLTNAGHWEFVHSIAEFAQNCQGITTHLEPWLTPFLSSINDEERLLHISLKSALTDKLAKLDAQRDGLASSIKGAVNAMQKSIDPDTVEAAENVMNEITSLKVDIQDNYMNETGQIDTLVAVLLSSQRENVEKLGLLQLVESLKSANDQMHTLLNQRDEEQFARMNDTLAAARKVTDSCYNDFIFSVESYTFLHATELAEDDLGFTKFVNDTNARIEYYRRYVLKLNALPDVNVPGGGEVLPPEEEGGETPTPPTEQEPTTPTTPTKYTITFVHNGQTVGSLELEPGAAVTAPSAPSGYHWVDVPATMPARNVTINSAQDANEPPSLTK